MITHPCKNWYKGWRSNMRITNMIFSCFLCEKCKIQAKINVQI